MMYSEEFFSTSKIYFSMEISMIFQKHLSKSSRPEMFCIKDVFKNFAKLQ